MKAADEVNAVALPAPPAPLPAAEEEGELKKTRRRLKKALLVAEKLKSKNLLEGEVNKELARRNEALRKYVTQCDSRFENARDVASNIGHSLSHLIEITERALGSDADAAERLLAEVSALKEQCEFQCQQLHQALSTPEKATPLMKRSPALDDRAEAKPLSTRRFSKEKLSAGDFKSIDSKGSKAHSHSSKDTERDVDFDDDEVDFKLTPSRPLKRGAAASSSRRGRRNGSVLMRLPELSGTSLLRKSAEITSSVVSPVLRPMSLDRAKRQGTDSSDSGTLDGARLSKDDSDVAAASGAGLDLDGRGSMPSSPSSTDAAAAGTTIPSIATDTTNPDPPSQFEKGNIAFDTTVVSSKEDLAKVIQPVKAAPTPTDEPVPIFEHFIVVGVPLEVGTEFAHQVYLHEEDTISNRLKRTFGGLLGSTRVTSQSTTTSTAATDAATAVNTNLEGETITSTAAAVEMQKPPSTSRPSSSTFSLLGSRLSSKEETQNRSGSSADEPPVVAPSEKAAPTGGSNTAADDLSVTTTGSTSSSSSRASGGLFSYFSRSVSSTPEAAVAATRRRSDASIVTREPTIVAIDEAAEEDDTPVSGADVKRHEEEQEQEFEKFVASLPDEHHSSKDEMEQEQPVPLTLETEPLCPGFINDELIDLHTPCSPDNAVQILSAESSPERSYQKDQAVPVETITTEVLLNCTQDVPITSPANEGISNNPSQPQNTGQKAKTAINSASNALNKFGGAMKSWSKFPGSKSAGTSAHGVGGAAASETAAPGSSNTAVEAVADSTKGSSTGSRFWSPPGVQRSESVHSDGTPGDGAGGTFGQRTKNFFKDTGSTIHSATQNLNNATINALTAVSSSSKISPLGSRSSSTGHPQQQPASSEHNSPVQHHTGGSSSGGRLEREASSPGVFSAFGNVFSASGAASGVTDGDAPTAPNTVPHPQQYQYSHNPEAAKLIAHSDKKLGTATTTTSNLLYRFPHEVEPPPQEVCDFCLPLGGKVQRIPNNHDGDTMVQEILFGNSQSKRSGRCFVFMLEDKTTEMDTEEVDEEAAINTGKLYGICVLHPRLLRTNIVSNKKRTGTNASNSTSGGALDSSMHSGASTANNIEYDNCIEFESLVCYAFITRFPLFDFFFQIIFAMITSERLIRMEQAVDQSDGDLRFSRTNYDYLPKQTLDQILERITALRPPKFGAEITLEVNPGIETVRYLRQAPNTDCSEYHMNASDWALPTLLSWLSPELIIWTLSLLLCEAKVVVMGSEYGVVSSAVMGLLSILRPFEWVNPVIPMLPSKLMDFVESPVPILVGLTVDETMDHEQHVLKLLDRCCDPTDYESGTILVVLHVSHRELYVPHFYQQHVLNMLLPDATLLAKSMRSCVKDTADIGTGSMSLSRSSSGSAMTMPRTPTSISGSTGATAANAAVEPYSTIFLTPFKTNQLGTPAVRTRPLYAISQMHLRSSRAVLSVLHQHLNTVARRSVEFNRRESSKPQQNNRGRIASFNTAVRTGQLPDFDIDDEDEEEEGEDDSNVLASMRGEDYVNQKSSQALLDFYDRMIRAKADNAANAVPPSTAAGSSSITAAVNVADEQHEESQTRSVSQIQKQIEELDRSIQQQTASSTAEEDSSPIIYTDKVRSQIADTDTAERQQLLHSATDGSGRMLLLSKIPLTAAGHDNEEFIRRFIRTQVFSEFINSTVDHQLQQQQA